MATLKQYEERTTRIQNIQGKEVGTGHVVRTCSLSEADAKIMNGQPEHGFQYVLVNSEPKEPTEKEIRAELFAKCEEFGINMAKNCKTDVLKQVVADAIKERS